MRALLIVYDNSSYIHWMPLGTAYVASAMRDAGIDVDIYSQDYHHYPEEHLTKWLDDHEYDLVGLGFCGGYWQYQKAKKISAAVNASKNRDRFGYVLGGHGPSAAPEYFERAMGANGIAPGEVDDVVLERHRTWRIDQGTYRVEVDKITPPAYSLFPTEYYRLIRFPGTENSDFVLPMITARGCPFRCNFCYRMVEGYRMRSVDGILSELSYLQDEYGITYIYFMDELTMGNPARIEELCHAFIKHRPRFKWACNGRLNFAKPDILKLTKEANCVFINYGIEAVDDEVLRNMNKKLTVKQITAGIEATLDAGISPGLNVLWGNISDSKETLRKGVEFLLKYDDGAQLRTIRPVTPYPGSDLFDLAVKEGKIKDVADFYESKHMNSDLATCHWTGLPDDEFHQELCNANTTLTGNYYGRKQMAACDAMYRLYVDGDATFRGFRQT